MPHCPPAAPPTLIGKPLAASGAPTQPSPASCRSAHLNDQTGKVEALRRGENCGHHASFLPDDGDSDWIYRRPQRGSLSALS